MSTTDAPRPWPRTKSEYGPELLICRTRFDTLVNPRNGRELRRTVLECPAWCNVVALTPERRIVIVRQFRFGTAAVTAEIPGGIVDPGETHEQAAVRELREEAGYTAPKWTYLGAVEPNPAFLDNLCHHWLAEGAVLTHPQELDGGEDIQVETWDLDELRKRIAAGEVRHALVLTALAKILDLRA